MSACEGNTSQKMVNSGNYPDFLLWWDGRGEGFGAFLGDYFWILGFFSEGKLGLEQPYGNTVWETLWERFFYGKTHGKPPLSPPKTPPGNLRRFPLT